MQSAGLYATCSNRRKIGCADSRLFVENTSSISVSLSFSASPRVPYFFIPVWKCEKYLQGSGAIGQLISDIVGVGLEKIQNLGEKIIFNFNSLCVLIKNIFNSRVALLNLLLLDVFERQCTSHLIFRQFRKDLGFSEFRCSQSFLGI